MVLPAPQPRGPPESTRWVTCAWRTRPCSWADGAWRTAHGTPGPCLQDSWSWQKAANHAQIRTSVPAVANTVLRDAITCHHFCALSVQPT